jgi:hypothetical protein
MQKSKKGSSFIDERNWGMSKKAVRVIALALAALMGLGVLTTAVMSLIR